MTRCAVLVACVGAFCLGITPTASAEPVIITGGSLVFDSGFLTQDGSISLTGTRGFSLQGGVDSGEKQAFRDLAAVFFQAQPFNQETHTSAATRGVRT